MQWAQILERARRYIEPKRLCTCITSNVTKFSGIENNQILLLLFYLSFTNKAKKTDKEKKTNNTDPPPMLVGHELGFWKTCYIFIYKKLKFEPMLLIIFSFHLIFILTSISMIPLVLSLSSVRKKTLLIKDFTFLMSN